jgi:choline dehydrogenase-like flavoprotein
MVARVEYDASRQGVNGVLHFRGDANELHRQRARCVVLAGYSIETPRILLNSAGPSFPHGLANSSGCVGKYFMVHSGHQAFAKFPDRIGQYKAPPPGGAITEHFNRTMADTGFIGGYTIEVVGPHPCDFASRLASAREMWGSGLRRAMLDYNYWSGLGIVGEVLAQESNTVSLDAEEKDCHGLPVAHVSFGYHDNDWKLITHAKAQMRRILEAAGGGETWTADRAAHLLGGCRMGANPADSVVNADCRSHDVANLFICDGSVFTSSTAVNPSLTIQAIAARTADRILELGV